MIKTIYDWFIDELNAEDAAKAIYNTTDDSGVGILSNKVSSLNDALNDSFVWSNSPEGHTYWKNLSIGNNNGGYNNGTIDIIESSLDKLTNKL